MERTSKYHWLIEAHTFISLVESYSTVIRKTSPEHFKIIFWNRLKIWKFVRKKCVLNFLLVYIRLILKYFRQKLELQRVDSVQNWDFWPFFYSLTDSKTVVEQVFASTNSHKALESMDIL